MATKKQSLTVPVADKAKQDCHCGCAPCDGTCCRLDCLVQPRFFCGQLLTDADLSALLKWSRDRFGLSRYRHGWGVVCGLDVRGKYGSPTTVIVTPGYAVDCCGNDVIVCEDAPLDLKRYCRDEEDPCADLRPRLGNEDETQEFGDRLRPVDVYLQYNEESADPTTAMGRGSCKQASECEYSRTKESFKLVAKVGVAGTDPVRGRATKWHEEYEKCLDVLKNFRAQFQVGGRPDDVRQWLLRWLDNHPESGMSFLRERLRTAANDFFQGEGNLVAVMFILVQVCRNAYLNCDCFGCDEDVRLPLARVWMLPEDRARNQQCRVVAIDAYAPYRRPIQPECWPAPLGSVNVGRFIWHRWEEVCVAVRDRGLDVERVPFELPPTLRELEELLSCDLFVRCGERRFAYVLDTKIPDLNIDIFGDRVIGFCTRAPGGPVQPDPARCPQISIDGPRVAGAGQTITFAARLDQPFPNARYNWTTNQGNITSGQGTQRITVDTQNAFGSITATVSVDGLPENCPNQATRTTTVGGQIRRDPVDDRRDENSGETEDDFTHIPQIGPARAATLHGAGIRTFNDLANTPVEKLKELFPAITEELLNEWLLGAKKRAG